MKNLIIFLIFIFISKFSFAGPKAVLIEFWNKSNEQNNNQIEHQKMQSFLDKYLLEDKKKATFVNYKKVSLQDKNKLINYIKNLEKINILNYNKAEQRAYWLNLYNAKTMAIILENYPIKSITKIKDNLFSFGPWDIKNIEVLGQKISLNDIEHGILRPIYKDNRLHYLINCASIGCPNLPKNVITSLNYEFLANQAASDYINHQRGVDFKNKTLYLSSIYDWYKNDFYNDDITDLKNHLIKYANLSLAKKLKKYDFKKIEYEYDWFLNEAN